MPEIRGLGPTPPGRPSEASSTEIVDISTPEGQKRLERILAAMNPEDAQRLFSVIGEARQAGITKIRVPTLEALEAVNSQRYEQILNRTISNLQSEIARKIGQ
jgi:hypothetical protein